MNMNLSFSIPVFIKKGLGELHYPVALRSAPLKSYISCESIYFSANPDANDEPWFITCSGSFYHTQENQAKPNILAMFQNKKLPMFKITQDHFHYRLLRGFYKLKL